MAEVRNRLRAALAASGTSYVDFNELLSRDGKAYLLAVAGLTSDGLSSDRTGAITKTGQDFTPQGWLACEMSPTHS
jgi:hypothetical protein